MLLAGCGQKSKDAGIFYSLDDAYSLGFLTKNNLQTISNYHNNGLTPPEKLDDKSEKKLKQDYLTKVRQTHSEASLDDISIIYYYGKYNDCIAVMVSDSYTDYSEALREILVAEILFKYKNGNNIIIWKH